MQIRILLVDDQAMFREAISHLLNREVGLAVVGETADRHEAVKICEGREVDVVLIDIPTSDLSTVETTRRLSRARRGVKVIVLCARGEQRSVPEVLSAGACAFVTKESAIADLVAAIRTAMSSAVPVLRPPSVGVYSADSPVAVRLTAREEDVLKSIAEGKSVKEAAAALAVSHKTVETYRRQLYEKLGIDSVAELTKYAIRAGLTSLEHLAEHRRPGTAE